MLFLLPFSLHADHHEKPETAALAVSFQSDEAFLKQHTDVIILKKGNSAVAVVPSYQGRVMTSTFDQKTGPSFGWINRKVIENGFLSDEAKKGKLEEQIYIFGGEERFWLGPEGGQFAIFFKEGDKFEFSDWRTPAAIDTDAYELMSLTEDSAMFTHTTEIENFSGTQFKVGIERKVRVLDKSAAEKAVGMELPETMRMVGYETNNRIKNLGENAWTQDTGLLSIWILGMYNPSPNTMVVIPFKAGDDADLGPKVNDTYFGKVPAEYLQVKNKVLYFRGDGTRRGKIGISPQRSLGVAGSYDADGQVLTLVNYNEQAAPNGFVNSMWEIQKEPFVGDVINSYNDGSPEPGAAPLGPFYELETSSPAAALDPGETMTHIQQTYHFNGTEAELEALSIKLFGVGLEAIQLMGKQ
ncbi:MAG: DUF6786 family protein [Akkermansiaceae bacterium]